MMQSNRKLFGSGKEPQLDKAKSCIEEWIKEGNSRTPLLLFALNLQESIGTLFEIYEKELSGVEEIHLNHNEICVLPPNLFAKMPNLRMVTIGANFIVTVPEDLFANNPKLERVHLDFNKIRTLPDGLFRNTPNLHSVYLNDNLLISIPEDLFIRTPNLKAVLLHQNKLSRFPRYLFHHTPHIERVALSFNPLPIKQSATETDTEFLKRLPLASYMHLGLDRSVAWKRRSAAIKLWSELAYT